LVFDQPTPKALAEYLSSLVIADPVEEGAGRDLEALEALVAKLPKVGGPQKDVRHRLRVVGSAILRYADEDQPVPVGSSGLGADPVAADASDSEVFDFLDRRSSEELR
jgi:hypothetical protein